MPPAGFYINLDRSTERDARMRSELTALDLADRYSRFSAVDGAAQSGLSATLSAAEVGCFLSHFRLLQQNLGGGRHLHVIEDDTILSRHTAEVIERLTVTGGLLEEYDIILTDAHIGTDLDAIASYKKIVAASVADALQRDAPAKVLVMDISGLGFASTASYLVNRDSIGKICGFMASGIAAALPAPVDLFLRFLANKGHLRVGVTMPFITATPLFSITSSTMHSRNGDLMRLASTMIRRALYLDCDASAALQEATLYANPQSDGRDELILAAIRLSLSPDYVMV